MMTRNCGKHHRIGADDLGEKICSAACLSISCIYVWERDW